MDESVPDRPDWMTQMDERILELLEGSRRIKVGGLWMTPTTVARNLNADRSYVNDRMRDLQDRDLLQNDGTGYYRTTDRTQDWMEGRLDAENL